MNKLIVKKILSAVKNTLIAFLLALFVVTCLIINAVIPSESMEKTIMTGDRLIGNRLAYGINLQIGDKQICKKCVIQNGSISSFSDIRTMNPNYI